MYNSLQYVVWQSPVTEGARNKQLRARISDVWRNYKATDIKSMSVYMHIWSCYLGMTIALQSPSFPSQFHVHTLFHYYRVERTGAGGVRPGRIDPLVECLALSHRMRIYRLIITILICIPIYSFSNEIY